MNSLLSIVLMAPPGGQGGGALGQLLPILLIIVVFYFFMIRPQLKKAKDQKKFKESLKKGDAVVTIGGIHGKIADVNEKTFLVDVGGGVRLEFQKEAISMDTSQMLGSQK